MSELVKKKAAPAASEQLACAMSLLSQASPKLQGLQESLALLFSGVKTQFGLALLFSLLGINPIWALKPSVPRKGPWEVQSLTQLTRELTTPSVATIRGALVRWLAQPTFFAWLAQREEDPSVVVHSSRITFPIPAILLSKKPPKTLGKQLVFEKNDC